MDVRLLVIRTGKPLELVEFYALLGLSFEYHQHGKGPFHYSTSIGETTLEIYPLAKGQIEADVNLRLGFGIDDFDKVVEVLKKNETMFFSEPTLTAFGFITVVSTQMGAILSCINNSLFWLY